jgi:hypothetical protein
MRSLDSRNERPHSSGAEKLTREGDSAAVRLPAALCRYDGDVTVDDQIGDYGRLRAGRLNVRAEEVTPSVLNVCFLGSRSSDFAIMRQIIRLQSWSGLGLLLFVGLVWGAVWMGWISRKYPMSILWTLTATWAFAGIATPLWGQWRSRKNDREYRNCERLLSAFVRAAENRS